MKILLVVMVLTHPGFTINIQEMSSIQGYSDVSMAFCEKAAKVVKQVIKENLSDKRDTVSAKCIEVSLP